MAQLDIGKVAINHRGTWNSSSTYEAMDFVYYDVDGCGYMALAPSTNVAPNTDTSKWLLSVRAGQGYPCEIITYTFSDDSVTNMAWDKVHVFPEMQSLSFTLASIPDDSNEHGMTIVFDTPSDVSDFTFNPDGSIFWCGGIFFIEPLTRYEISITSEAITAVYVTAKIPQS